ncbi:uncharacterized protein LOC118484113 [Helianthus annuus]|uniref:uncharacterized protein LOC118484113 n=1 Tax=Helianthus annuus TaxID=4232 RepID=UPI00165326A4|nr:uncharacterized protein LOC118484113 [Helianthus annuus]
MAKKRPLKSTIRETKIEQTTTKTASTMDSESSKRSTRSQKHKETKPDDDFEELYNPKPLQIVQPGEPIPTFDNEPLHPIPLKVVRPTKKEYYMSPKFWNKVAIWGPNYTNHPTSGGEPSDPIKEEIDEKPEISVVQPKKEEYDEKQKIPILQPKHEEDEEKPIISVKNFGRK